MHSSPVQRFNLNKDTVIVQGRDGWFLANRNDFFIGRALEVYGEYGGLELQTLQSMLKSGDRVIEVGANIGSHTVGLAKRVGLSGKVYAYEPQRACYAALQAQTALNNLAQVAAFNLGCGVKEGVFWYAPQDATKQGNFGAVELTTQRAAHMEPARVMPLDILHRPDEPIRLIKVDAEGMETDVLGGGRALIGAQRPIIYVENDRAEKSRPLLETLFGLGYRAWWHLPPLYNPQNFFGETRNDYGDARSINMLCLHRDTPFPDAAQLREVRLEDPHPTQQW
jgi:FkbM family methyltransferase